MRFLGKVAFDESGQGLLEYSFILSLAVIVIIGSIIIFRDSLINLYELIKEDVINAL